MRTLIIIPAFNEEEAITGVLKELATFVPEYEVLVVDDGSADETVQVARRLGAVVAPLPFNLGIGSALRTGFRYALEHDYDRAVQVDADGQHDPAQITALLARLDGADMVIGSRFAKAESEYNVGRVRMRAMRLMRFVIRLLSGRDFTDTSSGFRAFGREAIELFAADYPMDYMDSVEALLFACYSGLRVVETPASIRQRAGGLPSNRHFKLIYHYLRLMVMLFSTASLRGRRKTRRV